MPLRFTSEQANRFLLRKQQLLPRSRGQGALAVVRQIGPVRASPAAAPYLALAARIEGFARPALETALYHDRALVRIRAMHGRLYLVPSDEFPAYFRISQPFLAPGLGDLDALMAETAPEAMTPGPSDNLAQRVLEVLSARGPCTLTEIAALLPMLSARLYHDSERPEAGYTRLGARLIPAMCAQGLLVHAQPSGSWRSDHYTYAPLSYWLSALDLESLTWEEALRHVIERYVAAFGPVTVGDVSHWLGGVNRQQVVAALMSLGRQLARVQIASSIGDYYMLESQVEDVLGAEPDERLICLTPQRDSLLMAYSELGRFVDEAYREALFDRGDESLGAVWAAGRIVGIWWPNLREERVTVRFFQAVDPTTMALAGEEARLMSDVLGFEGLELDMRPYQDEADEVSEERAPSIRA